MIQIQIVQILLILIAVNPLHLQSLKVQDIAKEEEKTVSLAGGYGLMLVFTHAHNEEHAH